MSIVVRTGDADIIEGIVPIRSSFNLKDVVGVLVADYYIPESISGRMSIIRSTFTDYIHSLKLKGPIKTNYIIILTSITLLVIFSAVWFGMNISKAHQPHREARGRHPADIPGDLSFPSTSSPTMNWDFWSRTSIPW